MPQLTMIPTGTTAISTWGGNGTFFGIAPATAWVGNDIDLKAVGGSAAASVFKVDYQGIISSTTPVLGGSTPNVSIIGASNDTNTAAALFINVTGSSPTQRPVDFQIQATDQFQICPQGVQGQIVFGSAVTCANIYQTTFAKTVFESANGAHTVIRAYQGSTGATGDMIQLNNATAAGTGYNFLTAYAGVTGSDTFHTSGSLVFSVNGNGSITSGANSVVGGSITLNGSTSGSATINVSSTGVLALSGSPTTTTQAACDNSTKIATTAYNNIACTNIETGGSPLTLAGNGGYYYNDTGSAYTFQLDAPVLGKQYCFGNRKARVSAITIKSLASVTIYYKGVAGTAGTGGSLVSTGAAGDFVCLVGTDATTYEATGAGLGTWTNN
jgi:hypothetical protein